MNMPQVQKFPGKQTKSVRLPVEYLSFAEDLCRFLSEKDESLDGKKIFKLTVINGRVFGFEEKL